MRGRAGASSLSRPVGLEELITPRARNIIILLLITGYLGVCGFSLATTRSWIGRPFPGFLVIRHNYVSTLYLSGWEGYRRGIKNLDRVTAVNGQPVSSPRELYDLVSKRRPGETLAYTLLRGSQVLQKEIPVSLFTSRDYFLIFPGAMLLGLFFLLSGLTIFYLKPDSPATWYLLLSFLALGVLYGANAERCTNGVNFLPNLFMPLMGPPMLLFSFYFPARMNRARLYSLLTIIVMLSIDGLYVYGYLTGRGFLLFDRTYLLFLFLSILLAVLIQVYLYLWGMDQLVRQKAKVAIYGFILCFLGLAVIYFGAIVPKRNNFFYSGIPSAMIPLALGYAMVKHNLFDVDVFIRRSLTYILASGIVLAAFVLLGTGLTLALQDVTGRSSQIATIASTLVIVVLFNPLKTRIDRVMDKRFFREKYEYSATIRKASSLLTSIIDLQDLLRQLLATVIDAIKIERGLILLHSPERNAFEVVARSGYPTDAESPPLPDDHPWLLQLHKSNKAVQLNDVQEFADFAKDRERHLEVMNRMGLVLAVPILYEKRLIGLLGLAAKQSGQWYSSEDMELLSTLMLQTAVSLENARKVVELKKMVELETSYRDLQKLDEMKDNFLSMVSHDLRTPMTSIKGYAAILKSRRQTLDEARQDRYLDIIITESDRLTRLINDLLDLQRFEAGRMKLDFQATSLAAAAAQSVESFKGAATTKNISLEREGDDAEFMVMADADRLLQVLANLLSNAVKFTPPEGKVVLSLREAGEDGVRKVMVRVSDNGPGIPPEEQDKLFNKFQRVESLTRAKEEGSGLGLALVKEIVEAHGGKVGMESQPGQGSSFFFTLKLEG